MRESEVRRCAGESATFGDSIRNGRRVAPSERHGRPSRLQSAGWSVGGSGRRLARGGRSGICKASGIRRPERRWSGRRRTRTRSFSPRRRPRSASGALCPVRQPRSRSAESDRRLRIGLAQRLEERAEPDVADCRIRLTEASAVDAAAQDQAARQQIQQRNRGPADDWTDLPSGRGASRAEHRGFRTTTTATCTSCRFPSASIHYEMVHETRTIWLDGRPHLSPDIACGTATHADAGRGTRWSSRRQTSTKAGVRGNVVGTATLIERFTPNWADEIDYRFTIDDPETYTRPVTVMEPMMGKHRAVLRVRLSRVQLRPAQHSLRRASRGKHGQGINGTLR